MTSTHKQNFFNFLPDNVDDGNDQKPNESSSWAKEMDMAETLVSDNQVETKGDEISNIEQSSQNLATVTNASINTVDKPTLFKQWLNDEDERCHPTKYDAYDKCDPYFPYKDIIGKFNSYLNRIGELPDSLWFSTSDISIGGISMTTAHKIIYNTDDFCEIKDALIRKMNSKKPMYRFRGLHL